MKTILLFSFLFYLLFFNSSIKAQWKQQTNGLQLWGQGMAIDACNNNTAVIAVDRSIYKTENSGNSWEKILYPSVGNRRAVDISIVDNDHFWITTDAGGILATSDGGTNWTVQFYDTTRTQFMDYIKMFDLNTGIAMGDADGNNPALFLTTTDGGRNWISVNNSNLYGDFSGDVWRRLDFISPSFGYFFTSGGGQLLENTTDSGKTWITISNYPNPDGDLIKFYNKDFGLIVSYNSIDTPWAMNRTTNGGNSWETFIINSKGWPNDIEFVPGNPSKVWFTDSDKLFYSRDTGRTWTEDKIYDGYLHARDIVFTDSTHGWLLCDSGKVFYTSNNGGTISDVSQFEKQVPAAYSLEQNYPNPFNPTTEINYRISTYSYVTLKVYDVLGNLVKTLVDGYRSQGKYSVIFDIGSERVRFSSGIYFYRLTVNNFTDTKKLIIIK